MFLHYKALQNTNLNASHARFQFWHRIQVFQETFLPLLHFIEDRKKPRNFNIQRSIDNFPNAKLNEKTLSFVFETFTWATR